MGYRAIMGSIVNPRVINMKLREIWAAIDELKALQEQPEATETETASVETEAQEVVINEVLADAEPFDWKTSESASALKEYAFSEFNLTIKGNKKAETVRLEIAEYLETL